MRHVLKPKCAHSPSNLRILSSTSVPLTLTMVQVPNLALTYRKRITVQSRPPVEILWCKKQENPSDQHSHTWAPLMLTVLLCGIKTVSQSVNSY
jgi:subtilisin-like proprotein convertase family protein